MGDQEKHLAPGFGSAQRAGRSSRLRGEPREGRPFSLSLSNSACQKNFKKEKMKLRGAGARRPRGVSRRSPPRAAARPAPRSAWNGSPRSGRVTTPAPHPGPSPCRMDFAHMYQVYKSRRGIKRGEDSKETYKLPHRLIEKKRRDRINECIAQLKDLLPEHLKLTTLGHLEKAVVLELTLKHVKALTSLIDQQQQQIMALQSGLQAENPSPSNLPV
uniref:BHLH domain-containing protein n=1 Tax=Oryctolagus cuniculus TaxID=9986 RepID=A0A5F9CUA9_RABIT